MTHPPDPAIESRLARLESMLSPDGTVRCERLLVMDAHGTPRIVASVSPSGEAMLEWLDSGKVRRVMVAARADDAHFPISWLCRHSRVEGLDDCTWLHNFWLRRLGLRLEADDTKGRTRADFIETREN
jgi:hypothetical protein